MSGDITADPAFTPEEKQPVSSILETNRPGVTRYKRSIIIGCVSALAMLFVVGIVYAFVRIPTMPPTYSDLIAPTIPS